MGVPAFECAHAQSNASNFLKRCWNNAHGNRNPKDKLNNPVPGLPVDFTITSGPNKGLSGSGISNAAGQVAFTWSSALAGIDTVEASTTGDVGQIKTTATKTWKQIMESWTGNGAVGYWTITQTQGPNMLTFKIAVAFGHDSYGMSWLRVMVVQPNGIVTSTFQGNVLSQNTMYDSICIDTVLPFDYGTPTNPQLVQHDIRIYWFPGYYTETVSSGYNTVLCPGYGLYAALYDGSYSQTSALLTIGSNAMLFQGSYYSYVATTFEGSITTIIG